MGANNIHFYIYVVGHLNCINKSMYFKWVPTTHTYIYIWCGYTFELHWQVDAFSNGYQQCVFYICCGYSFKLHWQVDTFQMGTNNIRFHVYVVGSHFNCTDKLMHFKWVPTTCFIYVVGTHLNCTEKLMHFKWVPTTQAMIYMLWVLIWTAMTNQNSNGYQQHMPL